MDYSFKLVTPDDAEFIVELRNDPKLKKHLSTTSSAVEDQITWIEAYKEREKKGQEYYFVIYEKGEKKGLYRLYNVNSISFTIGSWLFKEVTYKNLPILTDVLMDDIGFQELNKNIMLFDIRKDNNRVIRYSAIKKPVLYTEDAHHYYYILQKQQWDIAKAKVLRYFRIDPQVFKEYKAQFSQDIILP